MKPPTSLLILDDLNARLKLKPTGQKYFEDSANARDALVQKQGLSVVPNLKPTKRVAGGKASENVPADIANSVEPGEVKDSVEWGAEFANPTGEILDSLVAPTKSGRVNSSTSYRDVPAGTQAFNKSQKNGKQINLGADFAGKEGDSLTNPFNGDAKVVSGLGLSGAGNSVTLEYTLPSGKKLYADLNHNQKNLVKEGDIVKPGQEVALMGKTGNASGAHSDFSVYSFNKGKNPVYFDTSSKFK